MEARVRIFALLGIMVIVTFVAPHPAQFFYYGLILIFIGIGLLELHLRRREVYRDWFQYVFIALDSALLAFTLLYPNPLAPEPYPPALSLQSGNFIYYFIILIGLAFGYQALAVLWAGFTGALFWGLGVAWILSLPETVWVVPSGLDLEARLEIASSPHFIDLGVRLQEVMVYLIASGMLAALMRRSRAMVGRQVRLERERAGLARYFPPTVVDILSAKPGVMSEVREHDATILFADIVGFSDFSEQRAPGEIITILRDVHARLEQAVFASGGSVDKFIGDGMMATFGTPVPSDNAPANALHCVLRIKSAMDDFNEMRAAQGEPQIRMSVGVHCGPVVTGDIGSERRLEYAVIGDTVNVASRLEAATRTLGAYAVLSEEVVATLAREEVERLAASAGLTRRDTIKVKGRADPVAIWTLPCKALASGALHPGDQRSDWDDPDEPRHTVEGELGEAAGAR